MSWLFNGEVTMSPMSAIGVFLLGMAVLRGFKKAIAFGEAHEKKEQENA